MPNEQNSSSIELIVGGFVCTAWDSVSIDSDLEIPADSWSLTLFNTDAGVLPPQVQGGQIVELYYRGQPVLKGVLDRVQESASRAGRRVTLNGRDLAALLLDNAVPVTVQQKITIKQIVLQWVLTDLGNYISDVLFSDQLDKLQNLVAIEPSESIWSALTKAAESIGQYIWVEAGGALIIGNPFRPKKGVMTQPPIPVLRLKRDDSTNNVLSAEYTEDATELYSEVVVLGQEAQAQSSFYSTATDESYGEVYTGQDLTPSAADQPDPPEFVGRTQRITATPRRKIILDSLADTAAQAAQRAEKLMQDGQLSAYTLQVTVAGWTCQTGQVWATGWTVRFESDVMAARVAGDWVVMGRTLELSRAAGKITQLKLKRQQFWMQPIAPSPQSEQDDVAPIDEVY